MLGVRVRARVTMRVRRTECEQIATKKSKNILDHTNGIEEFELSRLFNVNTLQNTFCYYKLTRFAHEITFSDA